MNIVEDKEDNTGCSVMNKEITRKNYKELIMLSCFGERVRDK